MAAPRRMTRNVQIGLSHSERAKNLSSKGFYEEALKELNVALRAFETENREGQWDDAVAGVLNNAGFVYMFLGNYQGSEDTFRSALAIKDRLGDRRSMAGTLAGLADTYKGQCKYEESSSALEEAFDIAMSVKDDGLARSLISSMDALERTRSDMPDAAYEKADFDELYVPSAGSDVSARVAHLGIELTGQYALDIEMDIGFPYLMKDLAGIDRYGSQPFPAMVILFPKGMESRLTRFTVTDEEEMPVGSSSFDGIFFGPGSYHRNGPLPMPACKQYLYTFGAGHALGWAIGANGWYHVEASIEVKDMAGGLQVVVAMPFGSVKLKSVSVSLAEPGAWGQARLACGTFIKGRTLDTASSAFTQERALYDGPAKGVLRSDAGTSLKYGILCLDLKK
jgi:tetratricopeptide (TPR) repeat protein